MTHAKAAAILAAHTIKLRAGEIRGAPGKVAAIQCHRCGLQGGSSG